MISVSLKKLAEAAGVKKWTEPLDNDHKQMAARVITDFHGEKTPDVALLSATHWINRAYDKGFMAGIAMERRQWQEKIAKMFDVPIMPRKGE